MSHLICLIRNVKHTLKAAFAKSYMFMCNKIVGVDPKKVVFKSFGGKSYSDNPKAISEKLHEMCPEAKITWIFKTPQAKKSLVPSYVRVVKSTFLREAKELATAGVWVDNFGKPYWLYKSKNQRYIQTWHGDRGFKKILYDAWPERKRPTPLIEEKMCDLAIAGSSFGERLYRTAFNYKGLVLTSGSPRNDILVINNKRESLLIKKTLGIDSNTRVLLYAPTFRSRERNGCQKLPKIDFSNVIHVLEGRTSQRWLLLIRSHSSVKGLEKPKDKYLEFRDVSDYEDMAELLLITDVLITDYSSSAGDFALLGKPIVLFIDDVDDYSENERAFYFEIRSTPFFVATNHTELIGILGNLKDEEIAKNCQDILEFYGSVESGHSSEQVSRWISEQLDGF